MKLADYKDKEWSVWLFPIEVGCRGFPCSAIRAEAAHMTRDVRKDTQDNNKKTWRSNRTVILDIAPPRRSVLEVGIRRVVDWRLLLTHQLEHVMV